MLIVAALGFGNLPSALAQSMEPLSYTNAPIGLNFLIVGTTHQWGSVLVDPTLPVKDVEATVDTATLAYMRVLDFWGQSGSLALSFPTPGSRPAARSSIRPAASVARDSRISPRACPSTCSAHRR